MQDGANRDRADRAIEWLKDWAQEPNVTMEWFVTDEPDPAGHRRLLDALFRPTVGD